MSAPTQQKPGYKSTEFWLSSVATLLGIALASGLVPDGGTAAQLVGGALSMLASLGYTASRTQVKVASENSSARDEANDLGNRKTEVLNIVGSDD